jgi:plastocyanin
VIGRPRAPERVRRFGALFLIFGALTACGDGRSSARELRLDSQVVRLPRGTRIHDVVLDADSADAELIVVDASPGDVVRFTTGDNRTHAVAFDAQALSPDARAFLERTSQLSGPPLADEGASWIVDLDGAPPGRYPFRCLSHGRRGVVVVGDS